MLSKSSKYYYNSKRCRGKLDTRIKNKFWPFLRVSKRHKISPCIILKSMFQILKNIYMLDYTAHFGEKLTFHFPPFVETELTPGSRAI